MIPGHPASPNFSFRVGEAVLTSTPARVGGDDDVDDKQQGEEEGDDDGKNNDDGEDEEDDEEDEEEVGNVVKVALEVSSAPRWRASLCSFTPELSVPAVEPISLLVASLAVVSCNNVAPLWTLCDAVLTVDEASLQPSTEEDAVDKLRAITIPFPHLRTVVSRASSLSFILDVGPSFFFRINIAVVVPSAPQSSSGGKTLRSSLSEALGGRI